MVLKFDRACVVYVFNSKNEILMLLHKKLNVWLPPGGHVEENELIHQSAKREVMEETGVDFSFFDLNSVKFPEILDDRAKYLPQPFLVQLEDLGDHYHEDFIFLGRAFNDEIINNENHQIGWFCFDTALKLNLFENTKIHINELKKIIPRVKT